MLIQTAAWQSLLQHRATMQGQALSDMILRQPDRLAACEIAVDGLRLNYALQAVTLETLELLTQLAEERDVAGWRARMFAGETINTSENRAALHTALRQQHGTVPEVTAMHALMARHVSAIRDGAWKGSTGKPIRHIVNIGIGGSDLGPRLVAGALSSFASKLTTHFVSNVDAADLLPKLAVLDPAETLFVIASKTFTTQETLLNATTAHAWLARQLGEAAVAQHFFAVTMNAAAAQAFGIDKECILPLWDWVGGRFSLWSAIGFSAALAIGMDHFDALLKGAAAMDDHFRTASFADNMPVMLAMLGIWNANFIGARAHAILPYSERLHDLPRHLQQLEMESNGKTLTRDRRVSSVSTAPAVFGEPGTVGQHSFHQWLHQGSDMVSADFIGVAHDDFAQAEHHRVLLANMVAQAGALAFTAQRPSNVITLNRLDPYRLGLLLALYEHKIFVQSVVWNLNPFDQPGVELGKKLAGRLLSGDDQQDPAQRLMKGLYQSLQKMP